MLHMLFVNNMVIVSSNKILINESKDDNDNVNSTSETLSTSTNKLKELQAFGQKL
jgi:hypothetical protein